MPAMAVFHSRIRLLRHVSFLLSAVIMDILLGGVGTMAKIIVKDTFSNDTVAVIPDLQASFGDNFPDKGLEGRVVKARPLNGCVNLEPAPHGPFPWIAVIQRGDCPFTQKVLNAQRANYSAVIVFNVKDKQGLTRMGGDNGSEVHIPSTFVGYNDGMNLAYKYNYKHNDYIIDIQEEEQIDYRMYLWPFAIVVGVCFFMVLLFLIIKFVRDHTRSRVARLSKKHLKKIPIRKFKKGQYYDTCAICLDEYEDGEKIRVLPCDHAYHAKCIDPWLTKNKKTCPVCKRRVIPGRDPNSDSDSDSEGGVGTSQTTPLLLNSTSRRSHGAMNESASLLGQEAQRAASAPAMFETAAVVEEGGAVGGLCVSTMSDEPSASSVVLGGARKKTVQDSEGGEQREGRKKRKDRRADESRDDITVSVQEDEEEQRKAEKKERRKKRKERKKRQERRARRSGTDEGVASLAGEEEETRPLLVQADVDNFLPMPTGSTNVDVGAVRVSGNIGGYLNSSYSESQEVIVPITKGNKKEMSEVV